MLYNVLNIVNIIVCIKKKRLRDNLTSTNIFWLAFTNLEVHFPKKGKTKKHEV